MEAGVEGWGLVVGGGRVREGVNFAAVQQGGGGRASAAHHWRSSGASPVKQRDPIGSPPRPASQSSIGQLNHSIETRPASDGMN